MSGGGLTDRWGGLYPMLDWARTLDRYNPLLAEQLRDMYELLNRYDYYLAGDIGADDIKKAWDKYHNKWIKIDTEVMFERCLETLHEMINGHRKDEQ